ncbi:hypothetical protein VTO73DRAFT_10366 [Trametes versicolor]
MDCSINADAPPTQGAALSLVRAAHGSLSYDVVFKLARRRLCAIWDAENSPKASPCPAAKDTDTETVHTYEDAISIILFARKLPEDDLLRLYNARHVLQQR